MKSIQIKTLLQATVILFTGILLLGCPIDPTKDLFDGDIQVNNTTANAVTELYIAQVGSGSNWGSNRGSISSGGSRTFTGFDCSVQWDIYVRFDTGGLGEADAFSVPCGGTAIIEW